MEGSDLSRSSGNVIEVRAPALPAQSPDTRLGRRVPSPATSCGSHCVLGGGFGRGAEPPSEGKSDNIRYDKFS